MLYPAELRGHAVDASPSLTRRRMIATRAGLVVGDKERQARSMDSKSFHPVSHKNAVSQMTAVSQMNASEQKKYREKRGEVVDDELRVWRVLDANANRAAEGLRTLEDVARLVFEDAGAAEGIKQLRHRLTEALTKLGRQQGLQGRSTQHDAGSQLSTSQEKSRSDVRAIVSAESQRVGQALRVLEEFSKLTSAQASEQFKQLRYAAYDDLARIELAWTTHAWLREVRLCILIDCVRPIDEFAAYLNLLCKAGARCVQIREKNKEDRELLQYARAAVQTLEKFDGHVVVNDRVDIALASGAAGVHVGQDDLPIESIRTIAGSRLAVGVSTHNIEQARAAVQVGADLIGCGPSFPSQTKTFEHFPGTDYLKQVAQEIFVPSLAIGGIDVDNVDQVIATGVRGVAVSAAVHRAADPAAAVRRLCERLAQT